MPHLLSHLTRKGQVTIPAEIRRLLGIGPHDAVAFVVEDNQVRITPATDVVARTAGMLKGEEPMRSPQEEETDAEQAIGGTGTLEWLNRSWTPTSSSGTCGKIIPSSQPKRQPFSNVFKEANSTSAPRTLSSLKRYLPWRPRTQYQETSLLKHCFRSLNSHIILPGKRLYRRAFTLYRTTRLGFADCYHVA